MNTSPDTTYQAHFPDSNVVWDGTLSEDGATFIASDIVEGDVSEYAVTGRRPNLRVPVMEIKTAGGEIRPVGQE